MSSESRETMIAEAIEAVRLASLATVEPLPDQLQVALERLHHALATCPAAGAARWQEYVQHKPECAASSVCEVCRIGKESHTYVADRDIVGYVVRGQYFDVHEFVPAPCTCGLAELLTPPASSPPQQE